MAAGWSGGGAGMEIPVLLRQTVGKRKFDLNLAIFHKREPGTYGAHEALCGEAVADALMEVAHWNAGVRVQSCHEGKRRFLADCKRLLHFTRWFHRRTPTSVT